MTIFTPAIILGILALVLGAFLAVASWLFKVEKDERIEKIEKLLPGANCGGCGEAGCMAFAKAIVEGKPYTLCNSISYESADGISEILGIPKEVITPKKAVVMCRKSVEGTKEKYKYEGISDCNAAMRVGGGPSMCSFGCIGLGSCQSVCVESAIKISDGVAEISEEKCIGCGACKAACPKGVIEIVPKNQEIFVKCKNRDKGSEVRKYCSVGCISCRLCEKNCEAGAISVDGVAKIEYDKCTGCGICVEKCPKGIIAGGQKITTY